MARLLVAALVASLLSGCVYMKSSVQPTSVANGSYENYPSSIEANQERRAKRRKHALIAAPIEIAVGAAIAAAAIYGKSGPSMADSTTGALAEAGKEVLGRMLLAGLGGALAISGVGDGILGALEPAMPDSIVRDGKLVPKDSIDLLDPPKSWRPALEVGNELGMRGVGASVGVGATRWLTPTVRMQLLAVGNGLLSYRSADRRGSVVGEAQIERAFGREYLGLYPKFALGLYAFSGASAIEDRENENGPIVGGGVSFRRGSLRYDGGVSYMPYLDEHPMFGVRMSAALWLE